MGDDPVKVQVLSAAKGSAEKEKIWKKGFYIVVDSSLVDLPLEISLRVGQGLRGRFLLCQRIRLDFCAARLVSPRHGHSIRSTSVAFYRNVSLLAGSAFERRPMKNGLSYSK